MGRICTASDDNSSVVEKFRLVFRRTKKKFSIRRWHARCAPWPEFQELFYNSALRMKSSAKPPHAAVQAGASDGFSLLELLIAVTVASALAAIAIQSYGSFRTQAETNQAINDLQTIDASIQIYRQANSGYPSSLTVLPQGDKLDPWRNPYQYLQIEGGDVKGKGQMRKDKSLVPINSDFDLYSMGPDGKSAAPLTAKASQDDVVRATNGGYFGLASNY